jgi:hypothetical protein
MGWERAKAGHEGGGRSVDRRGAASVPILKNQNLAATDFNVEIPV